MVPVVSTDNSILDSKSQPLCFGLLALWWDIVTNYAAGLAIRGGNHTTRTPLLSVPGLPFIKCRYIQRPKLGAFEQLVLSFLLGHQQPQWQPGSVALVRMWTVVWASLALNISPILAPVFDRISQRGFSFRIACIPGQISFD